MNFDIEELNRNLYCLVVGDLATIALEKMEKYRSLATNSKTRLDFANFVASRHGIEVLCKLDRCELPFSNPRETNNGEAFYSWVATAPLEAKVAIILGCLNDRYGTLA